MQSEDQSKDINLYINSPGGSVTAGLAIYDTIRFIKPDVCTYCIGQADAKGQKLMAVGEEALLVGLRAMKPRGMLGDLCVAIQDYVESHGFSVVRDYVGHGVGQGLHEEPQVPNYVDDKVRRQVFSTRLRPGMVLAVEPMVNEGGPEVESEKGAWPVRTKDGGRSVHFEHTVAVLNDRIAILTLKPGDRLP